ncbi:phosphoenolpyruvate--protein phosphotransferase [Paraburkholderia sp. PREW-6R]|uniref:phosphoenolpyruvate--protein phosphotransferase n=1 Tax=Paraburkholderia sp. PREW-6R TaxID=3141544 RepID=UPI0031F4BF93
MLETAVIVKVDEGLHARPATQFAKLAKEFSCSLQVFRGTASADAKSAVKLMLLGVKQDDQILLRADGLDETVALPRLMQFLSEPSAGVMVVHKEKEAEVIRLSEKATAALPAGPATAVRGVPASEGFACGDAIAYLPEALRATRQFIEPHEVAEELDRFATAFNGAIAVMSQQFASMQCHKDIVEALADVAQSDEFSGAVKQRIVAGWDAAAATLQVGEELAASFLAMEDEYLRSRADDIRGVTRQVVLRLLDREDVSLACLSKPCIVLAAELTALDFARANLANIVGLVCTKGSATSHLAIMARSQGIPAVLGLPVAEDELRAVRRVALDGARGDVWFDPSAEREAEFAVHIAQDKSRRAALQVFRDVEPVTRDGRRIEVAANLGALSEIDAAIEAGAMGVGLFRTELLFMDQRVLPDEDEQFGIYSRLAEAFYPRPVVIRTLDVGGDKPVPGIEFPKEDNPFLGWRGVRMCLDRPDVFVPQLRALLRASVKGNVQVMVPMVDDVDEVRRVKALIAQCAQALSSEGVAHALPKLGIMIETPAAALTADLLAPEVDFFSIGTNDLTQYVMAVDRMNPGLASLYRTDHPAVLRAIGMVCEAARKANIGVAVCGEAAARPEMIPVLINLGVTELSMSPSSILRAKQIVSEL